MAGYHAVIEGRLRPHLGAIRLQDLKSPDVERLYAKLKLSGLADGSVRNTHTLLSKALEDAVGHRLLSRNPATGAFKRKVIRSETHVWDFDELATFLTTAQDHRLGTLMRTASVTGIRRGELLGLRWSDVDLKGGVLHIRRALNKGNDSGTLEEPKTKHGRRSLDLDPETVKALAAWRRQQREETLQFGRMDCEANNPHGLVFTRLDGSPLDPDAVSKTFQKIAAGAELPRIRFHDLRHTHGTLLLKQGTPLHVVSRRLGHASAAFTADTYSHVLPGQAAEAVAELAARLKRRPKGQPH